MKRRFHDFGKVTLLTIVLTSLSACNQRFPVTPWPVEDQLVVHDIGNVGGEFQEYGFGPYFHGGLDILDTPALAGPWVINVRDGVVETYVNDRASISNGVVVVADDGAQYHYWHLTSIPYAVWESYTNGTVLPKGALIGQIVEWTSCAFNHLHYELRDAQGSYEPIVTLLPSEDPSDPNLQSVSFVENATNNLMPTDPSSIPILSGDVDIIAQASDTLAGVGIFGVHELAWFVEDAATGGSVVVPEHVMRFRHIPSQTAVFNAYRNSPPFDSVSDYCATDDYYYVPTNVDASGEIVGDAAGSWDTTSLSNGSYWVHVIAKDHWGNQDAIIQEVIVSN